MLVPNYTKETKLLNNYKFIAGVDEVGRGPLAGPVVAAVVILDPKKIGKYRSNKKWWSAVRDSKMLSSKKREALSEVIKENAIDFAIGQASHQEIDELNIHHASLLAMKRAVENLDNAPEAILLDGKFIIPSYLSFPRRRESISIPQQAMIDGDAKILSIACASIIAKVHRDNLMIQYDAEYQDFGFAKHKGYDTNFHRKQFLRHGPCAIHRMSFGIVREMMNQRFFNLSSRDKT